MPKHYTVTPTVNGNCGCCVAAFDFDGTLASGHTLLPFLVQTCGRGRVFRTLLWSAVRTRNRDDLKVKAVGALFKGMPMDRLVQLGELYAATLPDMLRPRMIERLRWHQDQGHITVIVSASLGVYLRPLARQFGIDGVLGVELTADESGVLNGQVIGDVNNRGREKVVRLTAWAKQVIGEGTNFELWAYGDDDGDRELLGIADHPVWVRS